MVERQTTDRPGVRPPDARDGFMYTPEESDTFSFCIRRRVLDPAERRVMRALVEAMEQLADPRGVTADELSHELGPDRAGGLARVMPSVLGDLARDTREHRVPIAIAVDADGTLRYGLSPQQRELIQAALWQTAPPIYLLGVP
jgi:hypothetical protein